MIASCSIAELEEAAGAAEWFFCKTRNKPFDKEAFMANWEALFNAKSAFIMTRRNDIGEIAEAIGVIIHPELGEAFMAASTGFWYINGDPKGLAGGTLYQSVLDRLAGWHPRIKRFYFSALLDERYGKVTGFLVKSGFVPVEIHYMKEL